MCCAILVAPPTGFRTRRLREWRPWRKRSKSGCCFQTVSEMNQQMFNLKRRWCKCLLPLQVHHSVISSPRDGESLQQQDHHHKSRYLGEWDDLKTFVLSIQVLMEMLWLGVLCCLFCCPCVCMCDGVFAALPGSGMFAVQVVLLHAAVWWKPGGHLWRQFHHTRQLPLLLWSALPYSLVSTNSLCIVLMHFCFFFRC